MNTILYNTTGHISNTEIEDHFVTGEFGEKVSTNRADNFELGKSTGKRRKEKAEFAGKEGNKRLNGNKLLK
jgi:hypothetical protein